MLIKVIHHRNNAATPDNKIINTDNVKEKRFKVMFGLFQTPLTVGHLMNKQNYNLVQNIVDKLSK